MSGEESMVLSHIQASGNEGVWNACHPITHSYDTSLGVWTKHLKAKTELHQTVIDRCLKSLTQKQLIKAVKSVKVRCPPLASFLTDVFRSIRPARYTCSTT